ncbi:MAG: hypothetical protein ABIH01_01735 [Candidatus Omnitrophota bacterium]
MKKGIRNYWLAAIGCCLAIIFIAGCAEITPPTPMDIIKNPMGNQPTLRVGYTKDQVKAEWGEPDDVELLGATKLGAAREKWTYYGQISSMPIDYKFLSKTKRLYFEGNVLTKWESD